MNGQNGQAVMNGAALAALPAAAATLSTEAPASVTVRVIYRGRDVMLTLRGTTGGEVLGKLDTALTWLDDHGLTTAPAPANNSSSTRPAAAVDSTPAPVCPTHRRPMKAGRKGGWYCTAKLIDDDGTGKPVYCRQRMNGGTS